jgi:hypothetical protein
VICKKFMNWPLVSDHPGRAQGAARACVRRGSGEVRAHDGRVCNKAHPGALAATSVFPIAPGCLTLVGGFDEKNESPLFLVRSIPAVLVNLFTPQAVARLYGCLYTHVPTSPNEVQRICV